METNPNHPGKEISRLCIEQSSEQWGFFLASRCVPSIADWSTALPTSDLEPSPQIRSLPPPCRVWVSASGFRISSAYNASLISIGVPYRFGLKSRLFCVSGGIFQVASDGGLNGWRLLSKQRTTNSAILAVTKSAPAIFHAGP